MPLLDPRSEIIIFDMDGTLIDVSDSYRATTPLTASMYLEIMGLTPPELTGEVYDVFKQMGGFNDDWDLTTGILEIILSMLPETAPSPPVDPPALTTLLPELRETTRPLRQSKIPSPDWDAWIEPVRAAGGGLTGLRRLTGGRNAHFVYNSGAPRTTDLVQRLFSEIYLGATLFEECYGFPAHFVTGTGLIEREHLLISRETLAALGRKFRLGIATGRTRFEAAQAMRIHALGPCFDAVATMTDALEAQVANRLTGHNALLKPHPFLLQQAADALDAPSSDRRPLPAIYVGDTPDDIVAAVRANGSRSWQAIGLAPTGSTLRDLQLGLGARRVFEHPDQLMQLL